jgi:peptide/nickel transport system permease protein
MEHTTLSGPGLPSASEQKQKRLALWLQFPRRALFLLIAFGLGAFLFPLLRGLLGDDITRPGALFDLGQSYALHRPVSDVIVEHLPNTLLLLGLAFGAALLISFVTTTVAFFTHRLEDRSTSWGFLLNRLGRLWIFADIALPSFVLGLLLIWVFAIRLDLLPAFGLYSPESIGDPADRIRHLILPVAALVFMPAGLAAQAAARRIRLAGQKGFRAWLAGIFNLLAGLFRQTGGVLGAIILTESVFAWPGIGRLIYQATGMLDIPLLFGCTATIALLVLAGRLCAELFDWLARIADPEPTVPPEPNASLKKARKTWLIIVLVLLAILLSWTIYGMSVSQNAVYETSLTGKNYRPPSAAHLLGTDRLGRDTWARLARGSAITFGMAAAVSGITLVLAFPSGLLAGWLSRRRKWWADVLSDLALLPADIVLFLPAVIGGTLLVVIQRGMHLSDLDSTWVLAGGLTSILILPRMTRLMAQLWTDAPDGKAFKRAGISLAGLFLGGLFSGSVILTSLSFFGVGINPPAPSLGGMLTELLYEGLLFRGISSPLAAGLVLWFSLWVFYLAADSLLGDWPGKDAMHWLNA